MSLTNYGEDALLNALFGKTSSFGALASRPTLYIGLSTATLTDAGTITGEPTSTGGYARIATAASDWTASSGSGIVSATPFAFAESTLAWSTGATELTDFFIADALTNGNMIAFGSLTTHRTVNAAGVTLSFAAGSLTATAD